MAQLTHKERDYRQNIAAKALIFLAGEELEVVVRNISVTGLYAELDEDRMIKSAEDLVKVIKKNPLIDILFEQLDFAGEAKVIRLHRASGKLTLGIEYKNISFGVSSHIYKRRVYRKGMNGPGYIMFNGKRYLFNANNVSVEGLMISIPRRVPVKRGSVASFIFNKLKLKGKAKVIWADYDEAGFTVVGLRYVKLEQSVLAGKVPTFLRSRRK